MSQTSKIYRSVNHKNIAGVCSGIALSKGWSVSLTRLVALLIICSTGFGLLLYALLWVILPKWDPSVLGNELDALPHDAFARNPKNKIIAGVCGAVAEYFGWDAALVRVGFALLILLGGVGIVPYFWAWMVIPSKFLTQATT